MRGRMAGMRTKTARITLSMVVLLLAPFVAYWVGERNGFQRGYTQAEDDNGIVPPFGAQPVSDLVLQVVK
jgi:hypothetical protein